ncbi:hypothetical protein 1 [Wenling crustacean virus 6]|uniref:hypothetical protein 1 n=1 Tax=Wenling crustacean virus 6 TaxID=1923489 RepID=UPI00090AC0D8|nr:hypothetical protein 1 [Wenling crustacean virus 6]APG78478.1 hypothetical protein 1 [Wenling crustacean virus 6]
MTTTCSEALFQQEDCCDEVITSWHEQDELDYLESKLEEAVLLRPAKGFSFVGDRMPDKRHLRTLTSYFEQALIKEIESRNIKLTGLWQNAKVPRSSASHLRSIKESKIVKKSKRHNFLRSASGAGIRKSFPPVLILTKRPVVKGTEQGLFGDYLPPGLTREELEVDDKYAAWFTLLCSCLSASKILECFQVSPLIDFVFDQLDPITLKRFQNMLLILAKKYPEDFDLAAELNAVYITTKDATPAVRKSNKRRNRIYLDMCYADPELSLATRPVETGVEQGLFSLIQEGPGKMENILNSTSSTLGKLEDLSDQASSTIGSLENKLSNLLDSASETIKNLEPEKRVGEVDKALSFLDKVKKNSPALLMNLVSLVKSKDMISITSAVTNIVFLLDLDGSIVEKFLELFRRPTTNPDTATSGTEQVFTSTLSLLGIGASFLGDYSPSKLLAGNSRGLFTAQKEMEAMEKISELFMGALSEWGIWDSEQSKTINTLKAQLKEIIEATAEYETLCSVRPAAFLREKYFRKFMDHFRQLESIRIQVTDKSYNSLNGTNFVGELMALHARFKDLKRVVDKARAVNGMRPVTVGLVFLGEPGIGKSQIQSTLLPAMIKRWNARNLGDNPCWEGLDDIKEWKTWNQNTRDNYHEGYFGQEIHAIDDMFQTADDSDHLDFINMLSGALFPTVQADLLSKGTPYKARLCVGSANKFPTASKTCKSVAALQRRFIVVECKATGPVPTQYDPSFGHLTFSYWTDGRDYAQRTAPTIATYHEILDLILENMLVNDRFYEETLNDTHEEAASSTSDWRIARAKVDDLRMLKGDLELDGDWITVIQNLGNQEARKARSLKVLFTLDPNQGEGSYGVCDLAARYPVWRNTAFVLRQVMKMTDDNKEKFRQIFPQDCWVEQDGLFTHVSSAVKMLRIAGQATFQNAMTDEEFESETFTEMFWMYLKKVKDIIMTTVSSIWDFAKTVWKAYCDTTQALGFALTSFICWLTGMDPHGVAGNILTVIFSSYIGAIITQLFVLMCVTVWVVVRITMLRKTQTCESCRNKSRDDYDAYLLCEYCRLHCKIGTFYTTHTEQCVSLRKAVQEVSYLTCNACRTAQCSNACKHQAETVNPDKRSLNVYLDAVKKCFPDDSEAVCEEFEQFPELEFVEENSSQSMRSPKRPGLRFEATRQESSSMSVKGKPRQKLYTEAKEENSSQSRQAPRRAQYYTEVYDGRLRRTASTKIRTEGQKFADDVNLKESDRKTTDLVERFAENAKEEMCVDGAAMALHKTIRSSTVMCWKVNHMTGKVIARLHGVCFGNHIIVPRHFSENDQPGEFDYYFLDVRSRSLPDELQKAMREKIQMHVVANGTVTLKSEKMLKYVNIPRNEFTSIRLVKASTKHDYAIWIHDSNPFPMTVYNNMVTKDDIAKKGDTIPNALQHIPSSDVSMMVAAALVKDMDFDLNTGTVYETTKTYEKLWRVRSFIVSGAQTSEGDCGGSLIACDKRLRNKFLGIHVIGSEMCSYAAIVMKEEVDAIINNPKEEMFVVEQKATELPIVDTLEQINYIVDDPAESPECFEYLGETDNYYPEATQSSLNKHLFFMTFLATACPAALKPEQVEDKSELSLNRHAKPSILTTQYEKYGKHMETSDDLTMDLRDMAAQLKDRYVEVLASHDTGIANLDDAINGVKGDPDSHPLDLRTSAGIPWSTMDVGGKKRDFMKGETMEDGEIRYSIDNTTPAGKLLLTEVNRKKQLARNKTRTMSIWKNCIKDETRPTEKVRIGKSRLFTAAPLDFVILCRQYMGKFKVAWTKERENLFHSVGINPMSMEWANLYNKMKRKTPYGNDADFGRFDGNLRADFMEAAASVVIKSIVEMNDLDVNDENVLITLWDEIIRTIHVSRTNVSMTTHGNPSGNPMTTVVNCIVNLLYHWYAYRKITGNTSLESFENDVVFTCFGDDVLWATNGHENGMTFHAVADVMTELGQEYTTAAKEAASSASEKPIKELQFLKRSFSPISEIRILSPLEKESIEQQFNYTHMQPNDIEGISSQIQEASIEAAQHGPAYYAYFKKKISDVISKLNLQHRIQRVIGYSDAYLALMKRYDTAIVAPKKSKLQ